MVSQPYKDLIADGAWSRGAASNRQTPAQLGITRADRIPNCLRTDRQRLGTGAHRLQPARVRTHVSTDRRCGNGRSGVGC